MSKKRVIKVTAFLAVFVLLFSLCSTAFVTNSNNTRSIQGIYAEEKNTIDVLMVGASSVKTNFSSSLAYRDYGFTSYTLSFDGTSFVMLETLTKEALKTQSPELVLIDLKPVSAELTNQGARSVIDNIKWSDNKKNAIEKFAPEDSKISFYLTLDKYHSRWKDISSVFGYYYYLLDEAIKYDALSEYSFKELFIDKKHFLKGFFTTGKIAPAQMYKSYEEVDDLTAIDKGCENALYDMIDFLSESNINFAFYISPLCYYEKLVVENEYPQKLNYAKKIIEDKGYKCYDFRTKEDIENMGLDFSTDFGDNLHMNINGALKFTDYFSKFLCENYDLPDHRGDEEYDGEWLRSVKIAENVVDYWKKK